MPRWILLEHVDAPDDPLGRHFDLLIEDGETCRTWRLAALPLIAGPAVAATAIAPHRRAWLDHEAGAVSGGRGFARRLAGGSCTMVDPPMPTGARAAEVGPERVVVRLEGEPRDGVALHGVLILERGATGWDARLVPAG